MHFLRKSIAAGKLPYAETNLEAILGYSLLIVANFVSIAVYIAAGTLVVPLNCGAYSSGCHHLSLIAFVLYFQAFYFLSTFLATYQQTVMIFPSLPWQWTAGLGGGCLVLTVVVLLTLGPQFCTKNTFILSFNPFLLQISFLISVSIWVQRCRCEIADNCNGTHVCENPSTRGNATKAEPENSSTISHLIEDEAIITQDRDHKNLKNLSDEFEVPYRDGKQGSRANDGVKGDCSAIYLDSTPSNGGKRTDALLQHNLIDKNEIRTDESQPLTTKAVLANVYVVWPGWKIPRGSATWTAKVKAGRLHLLCTYVIVPLLLGVYALCLQGTKAYIEDENSGSLWGHASFVSFFSSCCKCWFLKFNL
mmetsp:Transcript_9309/g.12979  ORF Transcript_9309/g.12979 Transcript_9309/m.12979 type:complete len:363 (-) Transcript_9309:787-1875(-)